MARRREVRRGSERNQRGVVFPSPGMILSIVAVAMAGVAWFATRHHEPAERVVVPSAQQSPGGQHRTHTHHQRHAPSRPALNRSQVMVDVFNNSQVSGLAARVASQASNLGWQVVGSDNWYGTIPATTIYYPAGMEPAARLLAQDIGVQRVMPAVDPMSTDRLTVILTADFG